MKELLEFSNQNLGGNDIKEICDSLQNGELRILSLRDCMLYDQDFKRIMNWVGQSRSLLQLSLNVGVIGDNFRVQLLAQALRKNRSLTTLFLHGNTIGDDGMKLLCPIISKHPHIVSLDVGDCQLGDLAVEIIASDLIQSRGTKPGLCELGLCYNLSVTAEGWARLCFAVASSSSNLRQLYVDYNQIGETAFTCLLVGLVARNGLEVLDLEGAGITEENAYLLLHILQNYDISLKKINLAENDISSTVLESIRRLIRECDSESHSTSSISREQPSLAQSEPPLIYSETEGRSMISLKSPETMSARLGDLEVENIENDEKMKITGDSKITTMTDDILFLARALESQDKDKYSPESLVEGEGTNSLQTSEKSSEFRVDLEDGSMDTDWEELQIVKSTGRLLMVRQLASTVSGVEDIDDMTEELASIQFADLGDHETVSSYHPSTTQSFHSLRNSHLSLM